jgi:hypothetical protein
VRLPGNANLADYEQADELTQGGATASGDENRTEATLLRFEGPLARLGSVMENFSDVMHFLADDMQAFHERLEDVQGDAYQSAKWSVPDAGVLELTLTAILDALRHCVNRQQAVSFQVEEDPVNAQEAGWLAAGYYIKYVFVMPGQDDIIERVSREMQRIPDLRLSIGEDGECICEVITRARDACLSVIYTPQGDIRINYWHRPDRRKSPLADEPVKDIPGSRNQDRQPADERLH